MNRTLRTSHFEIARHGTALLVLSLVVSVQSKALASPILLASATAGGPGAGFPSLSTSGPSGPIGQTISFSDAPYPSVQRTSGAAATADYGILRGISHAEVTSTNFLGGTVTGQTRSQWTDELTVISSVLPFGTEVQFRATALLEGIFALNANLSEGGGGATGSLSTIWTGGDLGPRLDIGRQGADILSADPYSEVLNLRVGSTYSFGQTLWTTATVGMASGPNAFSAVADFSNTGRFFLDPTLDGYDVFAASGADYQTELESTVAPEPTSLLLCLTGLGAHATSKRRRRLHTEPTSRSPTVRHRE